MIASRLCVLVLAVAGTAAGAGHEFDAIVKAIETHFNATRTHIPLMGVANLALKVAHPAGATGFHLALFQDLKIDLDGENQDQLDRFMDTLPSPTLRPFIRTRSRENASATYVFTGETGKTTQVLVATFDRNQATVVEVRVNFDTLVRWIQSPDTVGSSFSGDRDW